MSLKILKLNFEKKRITLCSAFLNKEIKRDSSVIKKLISLVLCATLLFCFAQPYSADVFILGDVTNDKIVKLDDAMLVFMHISKKQPLEIASETAADVNKDGKISLVDAMILFSYIGGKRDRISENTTQEYMSVMRTINQYPQIKDNNTYDFSGLESIKLGAYFWYGFSYDGFQYTDRLFNEFSDRELVWGWVCDSIENMEDQIDYASQAGLSYFAFDWYFGNPSLNHSVDTFLRASNYGKMEFCLNVCNHEGTYIEAANWEKAVDQWLPYLTHPQSLKIDGKPVIMFFSTYYLSAFLGSQRKMRKYIDYLENKLIEAGFPGVVVIGSEVPYTEAADRSINFEEKAFSANNWGQVLNADMNSGIDSFTGYNYRKASPKILEDGTSTYELEYKEMASQHELCWERFSDYNVPYVPVILGGWDNRPWETVFPLNPTGQNRACYAPDRTPEKLYEHILNAADWMKRNPDCSVGNLAVIYAWDEFCEGGYIAPTKGDNGSYLAAIRQAVDRIKKDNITD